MSFLAFSVSAFYEIADVPVENHPTVEINAREIIRVDCFEILLPFTGNDKTFIICQTYIDVLLDRQDACREVEFSSYILLHFNNIALNSVKGRIHLQKAEDWRSTTSTAFLLKDLGG